MSYPTQRLRRLRKTAALRNFTAEHRLAPDNFVLPLFVVPGKNIRKEVAALPGVYHLSVDKLLQEAKALHELGIAAVLLFGVPSEKHSDARGAYAANGIVPTAVRALKKAVPELVVITDVCLCEYTDHGHCGVIKDGYLDNDYSLQVLAQ